MHYHNISITPLSCPNQAFFFLSFKYVLCPIDCISVVRCHEADIDDSNRGTKHSSSSSTDAYDAYIIDRNKSHSIGNNNSDHTICQNGNNNTEKLTKKNDNNDDYAGEYDQYTKNNIASSSGSGIVHLGEIDAHLAGVELSKMEISVLEQEYSLLQGGLKEVEAQAR